MPGQLISIEKIKRGDIKEFERLFHSYYSRLCVYAEGITRNVLESEEIVSSMFIKLWEKREQITIKASVESYLVAAVHHQSINYLKHVRIEEKYWAEAQYQLKNMDLLYPNNSFNPLATIITGEIINEIEKAIDELPPQCREIFILNKFENLSYEEIAERLGISINTVRTQLMRAMKKMRISLAQYIWFIMGMLWFIASQVLVNK